MYLIDGDTPIKITLEEGILDCEIYQHSTGTFRSDLRYLHMARNDALPDTTRTMLSQTEFENKVEELRQKLRNKNK